MKQLTAKRVQTEFNKAICRRDKSCKVRDGITPCNGGLQCSHFFPVGGNSCLRFYPGNAYGQCAGHHFSHHNRNPLFYAEWMKENHPGTLKWMLSVRGKPVRYTQPVLKKILELCKTDRLDELKTFIESLFGGR